MQKNSKLWQLQPKNASKRSSVAENLVKNREFANTYDLFSFEIVYHYNNVTYLIKMEAISIYLEIPVLCKQNEFYYKVSIFS